MLILDDAINNFSKYFEVKSAVSVKIVLQNFETKVICASLNRSASFIIKWKKNERPRSKLLGIRPEEIKV